MNIIDSRIEVDSLGFVMVDSAPLYTTIRAEFCMWPVEVSCTVIGDRYTFSGPSGSHSLDMGSTNADRLLAHWEGFRSNARNQPFTPGL